MWPRHANMLTWRPPVLTCVEASAESRPGSMVLPQVPQVPVALVLHQADHLFICKQTHGF